MKKNDKTKIRRTVMAGILALVFSVSSNGFASQETWNKGEKLNFKPTNEVSSYNSSEWTKNLVDLYQLSWYENPDRQVLKGEFMLVQLRTIQASLERRGMSKLSANDEVLNFQDNETLSASAQEEAKILKSLGILSGTTDGYMNLINPINRAEAAKVIASMNRKVLKIPSIKIPKSFSDTQGHWAENYISITYQISLLNGVSDTQFEPDESLTLEQTLQILENEIGYYGITRADVARAMNETFKVTLNTEKSNSIVSKNWYTKYEEKMKIYGFDKLYDNKSANTSEAVTKAEALKMAAFVTLNMSNLAQPIEEYIKYAKAEGMEIDLGNYNDKATYIDVIGYFEKYKEHFLKDYSIKNTVINLKDINQYTEEEKAAIKDMMANEIIYPVADKLNRNDELFKGQLNELAVNFAEKYNTIALKGEKINIDPEKMPSNASFYPYISSNVDKEIYEKLFFTGFSPRKMSARDLYEYKKKYYSQVREYTEGYLNAVLNVDYRTISEEGLRKELAKYSAFPPNETAIKPYVKYVRDNEIIIEGNAKLQVPIIYYDGLLYRTRIKLNFEIKNSNTRENLLYLDRFDGTIKTYEQSSYEIFVDYHMENAIGSPYMYMDEADLYRTILDKDKCGITAVELE